MELEQNRRSQWDADAGYAPPFGEITSGDYSVSPVPASSGKTTRHRLNRGGDRAANSALHIIAVGRLRLDEATQAYLRKRIAAGSTKMEAIRCLKRYIAREVYGIIRRRSQEINRTQITS